LKNLSPTDYRLFVSVCKWTPAALASEIASGEWFVLKCPPELIFPYYKKNINSPKDQKPELLGSELSSSQPTDTSSSSGIANLDLSFPDEKNSDLWKKLMRSLGGEYYIFSFIDGQDLSLVEDDYRTKHVSEN